MASDLITTDLVALDADFGSSVDSVITQLATLDCRLCQALDVVGTPCAMHERSELGNDSINGQTKVSV